MEDIELDFGAITIDTNVLEKGGYQFEEGLLNQMVQFADSPVYVIQTDIVHKEAIKHIAEIITKSRSALKKGLRLAANQLGITSQNILSAQELLTVPGDDFQVAEERLEKYYSRIGAIVLETDKYLDAKRLISMYFSTEAPFEEKKDKKSEFPDAIALLSLERWAEEKNLKVIAVSKDKGWKAFAERSSRIAVIDDLASAIAEFQPETKVQRILTAIRENNLFARDGSLSDLIMQTITESLESSDVYIEASSSFIFEESDVYLTYQNHEFKLDDNGDIDINVVSIKDNTIVLQVNVDVDCEVSAHFNYSVRDSIDKDYVNIGSSTEITEETFNTDILITFNADYVLNQSDSDDVEVEVLSTLERADFGEVEPDWGYDEED